MARRQTKPRSSTPANHAAHAAHVAVFPGSFDPATFGHLDVIARGRKLFDSVVVGVGRNPGKEPLFSLTERVAMLRELVDDLTQREPDGAPVVVEAFDGLTVDFARRVAQSHAGRACTPVLLRGIRNLSDLQSEVQQALTNRQVGGLETAFVVAGPDFAYTSSSLIRQVTALGDPEQLRSMVPPSVVERLRLKKRRKHPVLMNLAKASAG
ncbi:MAG: pantetheine-phosphate adenylyltransferase [Phycisphaeraceae bacterium]|nr:pantetheine-phosphate adenylyltransferase [Phycisphaeraceae bacterium]